MSSVEGRVAGLFIYPVKGCGGIFLRQACLTARGLEHDRRWMIVTQTGRFLTQREVPRLASLRAELSCGDLVLHARGETLLTVPIADVGEPVQVTVWRDAVAALAPDAHADNVLSEWLGRQVRLVRFPDRAVRPCDPAYAASGSHTGFADGFPLLVTSEASLRGLNEALLEAGADPVPMDRFRPNLVLSGLPAGAEDACDELRLEGGITLRLVKPCDRCVVTTVDQETGVVVGREPLETLRRVRRNPRTGGAWFGQNAVPDTLPPTPRLRLGGACTLIER